MRFYNITIYNKNQDGSQGSVYTGADISNNLPIFPLNTQDSLGNSIRGALNVELDITVVNASAPVSGFVKIWGIPISMLNQASNFTDKIIEVGAGMQKGLPLANSKQQGLILRGKIFQAWGNWQGTEQTLDFMITPGAGTQQLSADKVPISIAVKSGQSLGEAIAISLNQAYSAGNNMLVNFDVNISDSLILTKAFTANYSNLQSFNKAMNDLSKTIITDANYLGVAITMTPTAIVVMDGYGPPTAPPLQLEYVDFIGQPTWIDANTMQIKMVMRGDLPNVGGTVLLPTINNQPMPVLNILQSNPLSRQGTTFTGSATINSIRHVGSSRSPSSDAWVTIVELLVSSN
jgi:hypothetical protein